MPDFKNVIFKDNVPETVIFNYDKPKQGINKNNQPYIRYAVTWDNQNASFFADDELHPILQLCKVTKGTTAIISHNQYDANPKKKYWEVTVDGVVRTTDDLASAKVIEELDTIKSKEKPTKEQIFSLYVEIYQMVKNSDQIDKADIREVATSIFIQVVRQGYDFSEIKSEVSLPDDVPPPDDKDDLPF